MPALWPLLAETTPHDVLLQHCHFLRTPGSHPGQVQARPIQSNQDQLQMQSLNHRSINRPFNRPMNQQLSPSTNHSNHIPVNGPANQPLQQTSRQRGPPKTTPTQIPAN
eukprot:3989813-Alexandrium_andersonii.AAC.2